MATAFASSTPQIATFISSFYSNPYFSLRIGSRTHPSLPPTSPIVISSKKLFIFHRNPTTKVISQRNHRLGRIAAAPEDVVVPSASDITDEVVSTTNDGVSVVVSTLLFVAFIGLSILTIGVIYLGVTDFLQKREKEKFEKEEAASKSGKKKKRKVGARAGPKGFGQKIEDEDEDDD